HSLKGRPPALRRTPVPFGPEMPQKDAYLPTCTSSRPIPWCTIFPIFRAKGKGMPTAPAKVILTGLIIGSIQFGIAILALGGWTSFFSHGALVALTVITIVLMLAAPFASGNMSSGIKEDRGNRWVLA